jgi:Zn finger protein HypA/HybF involved in hydrogenase expression
MTISPSSKEKDHNMKAREVKCLRCKQHWVTDEMRPECPDCLIPAITVVKSVITDELASGTS